MRYAIEYVAIPAGTPDDPYAGPTWRFLCIVKWLLGILA